MAEDCAKSASAGACQIHLDLLAQSLSCAKRGIERLPQLSRHWPDQDGFIRPQDKVVMEASLLAMLAKRLPSCHARIADLADELVELALPLTCSERVVEAIAIEPRAVWGPGLGYLFLRAVGGRNARMESAIACAQATGQMGARERLPFRTLEVLWACSLTGPIDRRLFEAAKTLSLASTPAHPVFMTRHDGYALTHALFYLTNFGQDGPSGLPVETLKQHVRAAIAWTIGSRDFDLILEFIMAAVMLGDACSPYAVLGWQVCRKTLDLAGTLPGPNYSMETRRNLAGLAGEAYDFLHLYHPQFVVGLLCVVILADRHGGAADALLGTGPGAQRSELSAIESLFAELGDDGLLGNSGDWLAAVEGARLVPNHGAAIVADAALIHLYRSGRHADALRILQAILSERLPETDCALFIATAMRLQSRLR